MVEKFTSGSVDIYKQSVGTMDNNCYLLVDRRKPQNSLLIDAANDADTLRQLVADAGATVTTIVTTHSHSDHVQALEPLVSEWGAQHVTSALDADDIPVMADVALDNGDVLLFGDCVQLDAFIMRGHTKGGVCLALPAADGDDAPTHLFVGDSLFPGGVGKTNTPEQFDQLLRDAENRIFAMYTDEAIVHPGHGADTTVGAERSHLEEWRERGW